MRGMSVALCGKSSFLVVVALLPNRTDDHRCLPLLSFKDTINLTLFQDDA